MASRPKPILTALPGMEHLPKAKAAEPQKPLKVIGSAWCPGCRFSKRTTTGVLEQGDHLIWRPHVKPTWSNAIVECSTSGTRLCDVHPIDKHDGRKTECSCSGGRL